MFYLDSAFDTEKERKWIQLEKDLRLQIAQLEAAIKADMSDKNNILRNISTERGNFTLYDSTANFFFIIIFICCLNHYNQLLSNLSSFQLYFLKIMK